jgi:hypothetical protein
MVCDEEVGMARRTVVHPERLAFDTSRVLTAAAAATVSYDLVSDRIGDLLGQPCRRALAESRERLLSKAESNEAGWAEAGIWRVRLLDLLSERPDLMDSLCLLLRDASAWIFEEEWGPRLSA